MKKIAAIVLILYMMAGLCGCGGMQTGKNAVMSSDSVSGGSISGSAVSTTETKMYPENYFCTDRDIYYTSRNYDKIIRRPLDGSEVQKVCVKDATLLSVTKDWVYYSRDDKDEIWRMSIQHESGGDFLQEDSAERLGRCGLADLSYEDYYVVFNDRGVLSACDVPAKLEFYDFGSGKKSACMKELLSDKNVGGVEIVGTWDQYAIVTLELYDDDNAYGSFYQSYRYDIENDEYELISETGFRNVFVATESTLISDNWYDIPGVLSDRDGYDDSDEEEVVMYDVYEKKKQVLLTDQQIYDIFQKEIHPELSQKQIDWVLKGEGVYMDAGKIYVQIEALWHEGKVYQMRNYMISISTADCKIYYEKELSDLYETLVEPEKMIWTNNYSNKGDCPFYALEVCTEMVYRGKCILYAKSSGEDVSLHLYCYDFESGELRRITDQDIEYYYDCLELGEAVAYNPDDSALSTWPNKMVTEHAQ